MTVRHFTCRLIGHAWHVMPIGNVSVRCGRCDVAFWQFQRDEEAHRG